MAQRQRGFVVDVDRRGEGRKARAQRRRETSEAGLGQDLVADDELEAEAGGSFPALRPEAVGGMEGAGPLALRPLRVSSARFGAAVPFLADAGTGVAGARIGRDVTGGGWFHFDPWEMYRRGWITGTSIVQIGSVGAGKSTTAKATCRRLIAQGRKVGVPSDPKGEWARVAETVADSQVLELGQGAARINPLEEGVRPVGMSDSDWIAEVRTRRQQLLVAIISVMNAGKLMEPAEYTALDLALRELEVGPSAPTIRGLIDRLRNPAPATREDIGDAGMPMAHALRRAVTGDLAGMFDEESSVKFDQSTQMIVISTRVLLNKPQNVRAVASACTSFWIDSIVRSEDSGYWIIPSEEGWAEMRDPRAVELLDERQRLAGEFGLANWLIMHEISDLDMVGPAGSAQRAQALGLLSKAQVKIIHKQSETAIGPTADALKLTTREADQVLRLRQGEALWKIGDRSMVVETLITRKEWQAFNTSGKRAGL